MKVGVIGCGYWGSHLLRNFYQSDKWDLIYGCDIDVKQLDKARAKYPELKLETDFKAILKDPELVAVVIATPVSAHYEIARDALFAGKHVWVEKPLTSSYKEAAELVEIAEKKNLLLHVDHTYIYTPAMKKISEIVKSGQLGDVYYIDSVRINLGLFQHDVNVIWDLAPHDISVIEHTLGKKPVSVSATGKSFHKYTAHEIASVAYLTIEFEDGALAHLHVNWLSPVKIRRTIFGGSRKMLVFDDMAAMEKIKVYDSGVTISTREDVYNTLVQYRTGDMYSPAISNDEALAVECKHFYDSIIAGRKTDTPGESGLYVVNILEKAEESMHKGGAPVRLS